MRFEAKKKPLSTAASIVQNLTGALSMSDQGERVQVIVSDKSVKLRTVAGAQFVEAIVKDISNAEPGAVSVEMQALSSALAVGGDTFKVVRENDAINFACGRAKGRIQAKALGSKAAADKEDTPRPNISVPNFKALLRAISLKPVGNQAHPDRTLHFNVEKGWVCGETTDTFRAITTRAQLTPPEGDVESHSMVLPSKVMDTIERLLTSGALIGFNGNFLTIKTPDFSVCIPQSSSPVRSLAANMDEFLKLQPKESNYQATVADLKSALSDAVALASKEQGGRVGLEFTPTGGKFTGKGDHGDVEVDFDLKETGDGGKTIKTLLVPSFLRECLDFYRSGDLLSIEVRKQVLTLDLASPDEGGLESQTTVLPLLAPIEVVGGTKPAAASKKVKTAPPPEEDAEEAEVALAPKPVKKVKPPEEAKQTKKAPPMEVLSEEEDPEAEDPESIASDDDETFDSDDNE